MNNTYYFTEKNIQAGFEIDLDSHHINHAKSKLFFNQFIKISELKQDIIIKS